MTTRLTRVALAALASLSIAAPASAAVTLNFIETGSGVVGSFSGSLDLTGMAGFPGGGNNPSFIEPSSGSFVIRPLDGDRYESSGVPALFGTGGLALPTSVSGDTFALFPSGGGFKQTFVPLGYVSGAPLSGSVGFAGATLASLGIGLRPFTTTLPSNDTITIIATPVPEPSTVGLMLAGLGVLGLVARRRRAVAGASQA
jgi:hypothetical protein